MNVLHLAVAHMCTLDGKSSSEAGGFPFKAQDPDHSQDTACLNSSFSVSLYGLLKNLLPSSATDPSLCMIVKYCCRNNEPGKETHSL